MSWESLSDVFAFVPTATLSSSEVLLLLTIANYTNKQGAHAYPSLGTLGTMTKLSRRTIQYTLRDLHTKDLLTTTYRPGRYSTPIYALHVPQQGHARGATTAPLTLVRGANHDTMGATTASRGATVAPDPGVDPVRDPEEKEKQDPECARALGTRTEDTQDLSIEDIKVCLDEDTFAQLAEEARSSLLAERVPYYAVIGPVLTVRMEDLCAAGVWKERVADARERVWVAA